MEMPGTQAWQRASFRHLLWSGWLFLLCNLLSYRLSITLYVCRRHRLGGKIIRLFCLGDFTIYFRLSDDCTEDFTMLICVIQFIPTAAVLRAQAMWFLHPPEIVPPEHLVWRWNTEGRRCRLPPRSQCPVPRQWPSKQSGWGTRAPDPALGQNHICKRFSSITH